MDIFKTCFPCVDAVTLQADDDDFGPFHSPVVDEKAPILAMHPAQDEADRFLHSLRTAKHAGPELQLRLRDIASTNGWKDSLAQKILNGIAAMIREGDRLTGAMGEMVQDVSQKAHQFARDHPTYANLLSFGGYTLLAFGILVLVAPWVLTALGFGEEGPVLGELVIFPLIAATLEWRPVHDLPSRPASIPRQAAHIPVCDVLLTYIFRKLCRTLDVADCPCRKRRSPERLFVCFPAASRDDVVEFRSPTLTTKRRQSRKSIDGDGIRLEVLECGALWPLGMPGIGIGLPGQKAIQSEARREVLQPFAEIHMTFDSCRIQHPWTARGKKKEE